MTAPTGAAGGALTPAELSLLRMIYAGVQVHVNPDGPGPRARLSALLDRFRRGEVTFEFDDRRIAFAQLTSDVQARFAIEPIAAAMDAYWARMRVGR